MTSILNSWKEIAVFLKRGVRTTQRWERTRGLPVHRVGTGSKAPVIAFPAEIQDWLRAMPIAAAHTAAEKVTIRVALDREAIERQRALRIKTRQLLRLQREKLSALVKSLEDIDAAPKKTIFTKKSWLTYAEEGARGPARIIVMPHSGSSIVHR